MKPRSLRRYESTRVVVSLDNGDGVRGFIHRVYPDHIALAESQGMSMGADGEMVVEKPQPGLSIVPRGRIVRLLTVPE